MNRATMEANYERLTQFKGVGMEANETKKLTADLGRDYHEVIARISILEGISKTELVRRALDAYASIIGDAVLFPELTR